MTQVAVLAAASQQSSPASQQQAQPHHHTSSSFQPHPDLSGLSLSGNSLVRSARKFSLKDTPPRSVVNTMPLSRTRSLLANINGVANGGSSGGSSANTPSEPGGVGILYQFPSLSNGTADHLPPLKNSGVGSSSTNNKTHINSVSSYNGGSNHYNNYQSNGVVVDLDTMSNGAGSINNGLSNGHSSTVSSATSMLHLNGMQTLPLVRHTTSNMNINVTNGSNGTNDVNVGSGNIVNGTIGVSSMESPIHQQQQNNVQSVVTSVNAGTNNNSANGSGGSTGSLKPKTMVAMPEQVMKLYMNKLTPYEHHEIFNYPQIYFIGANAKKRPGLIGAPNNCGYDDDQGSYTHIPHDHLAYRYEVLKVIGKGSFGQVVKAYDHKSHQHVALKMVRNEKRFHRQAQEEIRILEHLRKQDKDNTFNLIHMFDHFVFRSHMCITFELLSINLYELIKKNKFQGFSLQLVRKFAHSLLQCLDLLYRNKIIHCDMKPENVLLKQQGRSGIKVGKNLIH
jgi:hypothetical protein